MQGCTPLEDLNIPDPDVSRSDPAVGGSEAVVQDDRQDAASAVADVVEGASARESGNSALSPSSLVTFINNIQPSSETLRCMDAGKTSTLFSL